MRIANAEDVVQDSLRYLLDRDLTPEQQMAGVYRCFGRMIDDDDTATEAERELAASFNTRAIKLKSGRARL